ncbi:MAG: hypothetical protein L3K17_08460 [Thermoplasmata archaeon]|nr:hypothetical protein [Thermoplasmata archaeon]
MAWTLFSVPSPKKGELDEVLRDDRLSRQSQKVRDAPSAGGPAGTLYVLIEGGAEAITHADTLLSSVGTKLPAAEAETLYRRLKEEEENASTGMGLFFTD